MFKLKLARTLRWNISTAKKFARRQIRRHGQFNYYSQDCCPQIHSSAPLYQFDHISDTQSQLLDITLASHLKCPSPKSCAVSNHKDILRPGYHFVYFPQKVLESELSVDGYSRIHSPSEKFPLRMWFSGRIQFIQQNELLIGHNACSTERISQVRTSGYGLNQKIVVNTVRHIFLNDFTPKLSIIEERCIVYLKNRENRRHGPSYVKSFDTDFYLPFQPTQILLQRFSSLSFNGHKIHYDFDYCRNFENLSSIVVQAPLIVLMLLELFRLHNPDKKVAKFDYRIFAPVYVNTDSKICGKRISTEKYEVWVEADERKLAKGILHIIE